MDDAAPRAFIGAHPAKKLGPLTSHRLPSILPPVTLAQSPAKGHTKHDGAAQAVGSSEGLVISYLTLRRAVGTIGMAFPFVLAIGAVALEGAALQDSISDYYGTAMRNVFVGLLFAIALFLYSYRGYEKVDERAGKVACFSAIGVALFPTTSQTLWVHRAHFTFATSLFLTLSYFSLFLFTKTDPTKPPTAEKKKRNKVYVVCGVLMLAAIGMAALCILTPLGAAIANVRPVFWLESIALEAFGISWMTKGEALLRDR